jgi:hypothetical protein
LKLPFFSLQSKSAAFGNHLINMSQIKEQKYGCFTKWRTETRCLKTSFWGILGLGEIMGELRTYAIRSFTICDLQLIYWVINTSRWVWHVAHENQKCIQNLRRKASWEGPLGKQTYMGKSILVRSENVYRTNLNQNCV